jgi:tetratricopeptide (TPR) repeat protein
VSDASDVEALAESDAVIARLAEPADAAAREELAAAMRRRALALTALGRHEEALVAYGAVAARFSGTGDDRIGEVVVMALAGRVASLMALDRPDAAVIAASEARAAYDRHVAAFGEPTDEVRAETLLAVLNHAVAVWGDGHDPRVLAVYEDAIALARPAPPAQVRRSVLSALLSYGTALSNLGFGDRANALPAVVAELFGAAPAEDEDDDREPPDADEPPDEEIAALLAEAYRSRAWRWLAAPDRDRPTDELGARAVALYERTGPVIDGLAGDRDLDSPGAVAALLVRTVANGCAILAGSGAVAPGTRALLPVRSRMEVGIRMLGVDRWAADRGHPLDLVPSDEEPELELPSPGEVEGSVGGFPAAFAAAVRTAGIVAAARRSPLARELLAGADLRDRAASGVARAVHWAAWLEPRRPEASAAGVAMMLLAQGVFCAIWSPEPAAAWFPTRDLVRQAVAAADVFDWFDEAGVVLPGWLAEP